MSVIEENHISYGLDFPVLLALYSGVVRGAAPAEPGCELEMQKLEPHPRFAKSESRFQQGLEIPFITVRGAQIY